MTGKRAARALGGEGIGQRRIVLASASDARKRLLGEAGVSFETAAHGVDEGIVLRGLRREAASPRRIAIELAAAKAMAASKAMPAALVIGADQTLDLDGEVRTKPASLAAARRELGLLSGRRHALHSAVAIAEHGVIRWRAARTARLTMRPLAPAEIDWYLAEVGLAATSSVGAYQLEALGVRLFAKIEGDYFTILGLPLLPLLAALRRLGAIAP